MMLGLCAAPTLDSLERNAAQQKRLWGWGSVGRGIAWDAGEREDGTSVGRDASPPFIILSLHCSSPPLIIATSITLTITMNN
jgi:hypothetical protein